jgi:allantoinase
MNVLMFSPPPRQQVRSLLISKGQGPVGWYTGRVSLSSRKLVWEIYKSRGLDLLYESDAYNDDLPYWVDMPSNEGLLVIPYTLDVNDMKFAVAPGFTSPDGFYEYLKNAFDCLRAEGIDGCAKMMSVGMHCRIIGRPGRTGALRKFLEYVASFDDVWVCTRREIAEHWRSEHPYKK